MLSDSRFSKLAKGINLSHWYAQWSDYSEPRLATYFTRSDVELIQQMGFSHVRLTLDESPLWTNHGELKADPFRAFEKRLAWFREFNLAAIVDLHPSNEFKPLIKDNPAAFDALVRSWSNSARALASTDPERVFLEVMNEPFPNVGPTWHAAQWRITQAMRASAPNHTIIVSPGGWTNLPDILEMQPYPDPNLVYTIHWYEPLPFTHQTAGWSNQTALHTSKMTWPVDPSQAEEISHKVTSKPEAQADLARQIHERHYTEQWTIDHFDQVDAWSRKHGQLKMYLGEFGVYRKVAPEKDRLDWLEFIRRQAESRGWGWALWDYAGGFAIVNSENKKRVPDRAALTALGL